MSKKAFMKAVREICGISQSDLADEADVSTRTIKLWEQPDKPEPPEDVVEWLKHALIEHDSAVNELVSTVISNTPPNGTVVLRWYKDQAQRDYEGGADVPYTFSNAITRSAAEQLGRLGYKVMFAFPDEELRATEF